MPVTPTPTPSSESVDFAAMVPIGMVLPFAGGKAALRRLLSGDRFLLCDGAELNRSDFPLLHQIIGETWGSLDNERTFTLPDLRDKFLGGLEFSSSEFNSGSAAVNAELGPQNRYEGENVTQTKLTTPHTLTPDELPFHSHDITDPGHHHSGFIRDSGGPGGGAVLALPIPRQPSSHEVVGPPIHSVPNTTGITVTRDNKHPSPEFVGQTQGHTHQVPSEDNRPHHGRIFWVIRAR